MVLPLKPHMSAPTMGTPSRLKFSTPAKRIKEYIGREKHKTKWGIKIPSGSRRSNTQRRAKKDEYRWKKDREEIREEPFLPLSKKGGIFSPPLIGVPVLPSHGSPFQRGCAKVRRGGIPSPRDLSLGAIESVRRRRKEEITFFGWEIREKNGGRKMEEEGWGIVIIVIERGGLITRKVQSGTY